jgi:hypothetical protein
MGSLVCTQCGKTFTFDVVPRRGAICFKCHVGSVNLGFTYGRDNFHGPTIGERQRDILANAERNGVVPEYVGNK